MQLPEFLELYRSNAEKVISEKGILDVEFSGPTYQVQIEDSSHPEGIWTFVQLDDKDHFKDGFCSCDEVEDVSRCKHLTIAYLQIFNEHPQPLHKRFARSFWHQLCWLSAEKLGYDLKNCKKALQIEEVSKKTEKDLNTLFHQHGQETEETSLKFSGLSEEEIQLWREGRPSSQLQYRLSFWNDLAKWFMLKQEKKEKCQVFFSEDEKGNPSQLQLLFDDCKMTFKLNKQELIELIPYLATVDSNLGVHNIGENSIKAVHYDQQKKVLFIKSEQKSIPKTSRTIKLGEWVYVAGDGFYGLGKQGAFTKSEYTVNEIGHILNRHHALLANYIPIDIHVRPLSYKVSFDAEWNLNIQTYLFEPGDLTSSNITLFGNWVYILNKGFFRIEEMRFKKEHLVIPPNEVGEYVQLHRSWFSTIPGFEIHLASIEGSLCYNLSEEGHLSFARKFGDGSGQFKSRDFGQWVYVEGQGFFSKVTSLVGVPLRPGIALNKGQVASFIRMCRDDLQDVPNFFAEKSPISRSYLKMSLTEEKTILIESKFQPYPEYVEKKLQFFDDFVYIPDEGFYQLTSDKQLPLEYAEGKEIEEKEFSRFFNEELPEIGDYKIEMDRCLTFPEKLQLVVKKIKYDEKRKKYRINLGYVTEFGTIDVPSIWEARHSRKHYLFTESGAVDLLSHHFQWIGNLTKKQIDRRGDVLVLSSLELIKLHVLQSFIIEGDTDRKTKKMEAMVQELTSFEMPEKPDISGLKSDLRHYQETGLQWLWFLYKHDLSGLLCDDMGLGKTHQSMALMAAIHNQHTSENKRPKFLVICPTSVIYHWEDKLQEFLPSLKVCTFYGARRRLDDYDILLTSYGIWRLDSKELKKLQFELAIFDEIQMAKNESSRLHGSLRNVHASMRLGLTGTPIENKIMELKALFDLTLVGYMPSKKEFREHYVKPIEKEYNLQRKVDLHRFVRPFILRRKKEDVLKELPEKTEEVAHCGLLSEQETLYVEALQRSREQLIAELEQGNEPIPYIHIFALLSSLKQICDHPAVYLKTPDRYKEHRSGKWDLFTELLHEARDSNQKVVVFSQYLGMLDIIEEYLNESGIGFATIRGSTANRGDQIKRFNQDPYCEVFVGSLQASGLGVDLTAASVVIHYDRWWNAAREDQATDRVHRIGQTRGVQVFKLVTKGTFEEKIDAMIKRKGELMEEVIGKDDQHLVKHLSREELIELLRY